MAALDPVSLKVVTTLEPAFIFTAEEAELLFKSAMVELGAAVGERAGFWKVTKINDKSLQFCSAINAEGMPDAGMVSAATKFTASFDVFRGGSACQLRRLLSHEDRGCRASSKNSAGRT